MSKKKKDVREPEQEMKPETQEAAAEETGETAEADTAADIICLAPAQWLPHWVSRPFWSRKNVRER